MRIKQKDTREAISWAPGVCWVWVLQSGGTRSPWLWGCSPPFSSWSSRSWDPSLPFEFLALSCAVFLPVPAILSEIHLPAALSSSDLFRCLFLLLYSPSPFNASVLPSGEWPPERPPQCDFSLVPPKVLEMPSEAKSGSTWCCHWVSQTGFYISSFTRGNCFIVSAQTPLSN